MLPLPLLVGAAAAAAAKQEAVPARAVLWDASDKAANLTLSGNGLTVAHAANADGAWGSVLSTVSKAAGKLHAEYRFTSSGDLSSSYFGLTVAGFPVSDPNAAVGGTATSWSLIPDNGGCKVMNDWTSPGAPFSAAALTAGATVAVDVDFDAGKIWFLTAAGVIGGGNPAAGTLPAFTFAPGTSLFLAATPGYNDGDSGTLNTGATPFSLPTSAGFLAWDGSAPRQAELWDAATKGADVTLDMASLTATTTQFANYAAAKGAVQKLAGKLYFEMTPVLATDPANVEVGLGLCSPAFNPATSTGQVLSGYAGTWVYYSDGGTEIGIYTAYRNNGLPFTSGQPVRIAVDFAAGKIWFGNATGFDGDPAAGTGNYLPFTPGDPLLPVCSMWSNNAPAPVSVTLNCGGSAFAYAPPVGFSAWDTP